MYDKHDKCLQRNPYGLSHYYKNVFVCSIMLWAFVNKWAKKILFALKSHLRPEVV